MSSSLFQTRINYVTFRTCSTYAEFKWFQIYYSNLIPQIAEKSSLISPRQEQAFVHWNHFISEIQMNK